MSIHQRNRKRKNKAFFSRMSVLAALLLISVLAFIGIMGYMMWQDDAKRQEEALASEPKALTPDELARLKSEQIDMQVKQFLQTNGASYTPADAFVQQLLTDPDAEVRAKMLLLLAQQGTAGDTLGGDAVSLSVDTFDAARYAEEHPELTQTVGGSAQALFEHFCTIGIGYGYKAHSVNPDVEMILTGTSDEALGALQAMMNPLRAYVVHSAFNFSNFDYERYLQDNPDIQENDTEDFLLYAHMVFKGIPENREIHSTEPLIEEALNGGDEASRALFLQELADHYYADNTTPFWEDAVYTPEEEQAIIEWMSDVLFTGDSVMLGFSYFCEGNEDPFLASLQFHTAASYSVREGLKEAGPDSYHPLFRGEMLPIWDVMTQLNAKKVFLFFGLNDMVITPNVTQTYLELIHKILAVQPETEIIIMSATVPYEGKNRLTGRNITAFDEVMRYQAALNGWGYVDVNYPLTDGNGKMLEMYSSDYYVHVEKRAYEVWGKLIKAYVYDRLFGPIDPEKAVSDPSEESPIESSSAENPSEENPSDEGGASAGE